MKVLTIILMALFTANLFGADFEEGKYYDRGKIEIPEKHPFYPVIQFINKIQEKKFEESKPYCTKEYLEYAENQLQGGFKGYFIRNYITNYDNSRPLSFCYYKISDTKTKVLISFKTTTGTASKRFYSELKNGKWLVSTK